MEQTSIKHTGWQSVGLHLVPGLLITLLYILCAPFVQKAGYPAYMSILLPILVVLIPLELGILLNEGRKATGRFSLQGIVLNRERIPVWQYFVIVPILVFWCGFFFVYLSPMDAYLVQTYFSWIPSAWMISSDPVVLSQYPRMVIVITIIAGLILNGIAGPVVEELYFRGYLLPRIPASKTWTPLINVLLFSLYHFFTPWQNSTRILALIPMVYTVSWKRNIYLSIFTHCTVNTVGMLPLLSLLFN